MRSKTNLQASASSRASHQLNVPMPLAPMTLPRMAILSQMSPISQVVPLSQMTNMRLDAGSWRLPSGKALAEFALQAGFLAPLLLKADGFDRRAERVEAGTVAASRSRHLRKGDAR